VVAIYVKKEGRKEGMRIHKFKSLLCLSISYSQHVISTALRANPREINEEEHDFTGSLRWRKKCALRIVAP
jgi:hypothetical protein